MIQWTPGDDPAAHPLWEQQVNLERGMMRAGADKVRDRVLLAESRSQLTRTNVVRGLLTEWLPGVAKAIKSWVADVERSKGGPKPIAYPYVKDMDPGVAGLVSLRAILNGLSKQHNRLTGLAMDIGRTCEHEQRVRYWEATEPALFYHYNEEMDKNRSTATHRRRVNINRFNKLIEQGETSLQWDNWSEEVKFRVGIALIDCVIRQTGWFELQDDPSHVFRRGSAHRPALVLAPKEGLTSWLAEAFENAELSSPDFMPTIMPPRRWTADKAGNVGRGGYYTPYVRAPRLVRFKASQESQREHAASEYDALDMPMVYDAIHLLQETAWKVNTRVLDVAMKVWAKSGAVGVAGLPGVEDRELPTRTPRMMEHAEARRRAKEQGAEPPAPDKETDAEILAWKKKASPIHRHNAKRLSKMMVASNTILIAQQYAQFPAMYFPHMLDFRGRIYPIANYLQPQGSDLARGLLIYAEGLPITEENGGAGWLAIQLANTWGYDKEPFDKRISWVFEREAQWRRIAADPLHELDWAVTEGPNKVGSPFQTLAAIFEWVGFLETGWGYVSNLPVMVDGTCNGIQHLSAMVRDEVAGRYVNLVPSDRPQDIYKVVAVGTEDAPGVEVTVEGLQRVLERIEQAGGPEGRKATYWLDITGRALPRTLTKRQVMVLPYGGTKDSFFTYTREWLDENDPAIAHVEGNGEWLIAECEASSVQLVDETGKQKSLDDLARALRTARIVFLAGHLWDAVGTVVRRGLEVMEWLQDCSKAVAVANQPIYWEVPSGFVVRHFYGLDRSIQCKVMLDGETIKLRRNERTAVLSTKEQTQGIAPNFVHSLDASALVDCLRRCREAGIEEFSAIHDAYGTHAANMDALSKFLREAFVATHSVDVLANFRAACERVLVDYLVADKGLDVLEASQKADTMLPPMLEKGELDISAVLQSDYFFA